MADASDNASDDDGILPMELYPEFQVRCALFEGVTNATEPVSYTHLTLPTILLV